MIFQQVYFRVYLLLCIIPIFFALNTVKMTIDKSGDILYNNGKYSDMEVKT